MHGATFQEPPEAPAAHTLESNTPHVSEHNAGTVGCNYTYLGCVVDNGKYLFADVFGPGLRAEAASTCIVRIQEPARGSSARTILAYPTSLNEALP